MKKSEKLQAMIKDKYPALSNRKFAERAGIAPTTLQGILEKGPERSSVVIVIRIANALGMSADELLARLERDIPLNENALGYGRTNDLLEIYNNQSRKKSLNALDYFGEVSAGELTSVECIEYADKIDLPKTVLGKYANKDDVFIMKVSGESMNKIIPNQSYVVCAPVERHELKNNDIVIYSKNNESSMKRFRRNDKAIIFSPESTSADFYDVVIPLDTVDEIKIHAKIILYAVTLD